MPYDFDQVIPREGTNSLKYDFAAERGKPEGLLSMWVADMDFPTAPPVVEALERTVRHGIYGYSDGKTSYDEAVASWMHARHGWSIQPQWIVKTPGVVFAMAAAIQAYTEPGDAVLIQSPVYYPFSETIRDNGRRLVDSPLQLNGDRYMMDYDDLELKIEANKVKLMLFCSPHNPVGRVWTREELERLVSICARHNVILFSDEIHGDFIYPGHTHIPTAMVSEEAANITVTGTAPTKTFNLAGLQISNIMIANPKKRLAFRHAVDAFGYSQPNLMGLVACEAAYTKGEDWYKALLQYLTENRDFMTEFVQKEIPALKVITAEGTYLLWVDCSGLGLTDEALDEAIINKAHLWLDSGRIFGPTGSGFQRFNIACPRSVLEQALKQLKDMVQGLE